MKDIMPYEDWITGSLQEQQNHIRTIPEGDIQLIGNHGVKSPFAFGLEHSVHRALANPKFNQNIPDIVQKDIPNVVMKEHNGGNVGRFMLDMLFGGDRTMYTRDVLNNPDNMDIFPWHDFKMGGEGNIVSEWVNDLNNVKNPDEQRALLRRLKENIYKGNVKYPLDKAYVKMDQFVRNNFGSELPLPIREGKSGIIYNIGDIIGKNPTISKVITDGQHNLGVDLRNNPKILDFIPKPRDPGFMFKAKKILGLK